LLLGVTVLWRVQSNRRKPPVAPELVDQGGAAGENASALDGRETLRPAESAPPPETKRDILRRYWGDRWPEVEAAMEASGKELDVPATLLPWEEARAVLDAQVGLKDGERAAIKRSLMGWPEELTLQWLRASLNTGADATEEDLVAIGAMVAEENAALDWRAEEFLYTLHAELRLLWNSDSFLRAPFTTTGHPDKESQSKRNVYVTSAAGGGWAVGLHLAKDSHPGLTAMQDEIHRLRSSRDDRVRSYFHR
jgi:hypothetical protein